MSDIIGADACAAELKRLLKEITDNIKAVGEGDPDGLATVIDTETEKLVEYTNRTEPSDYNDNTDVEAIRKLDDEAATAISEIYGDTVRSIVARMTQRAAKLNQLTKQIRQLSSENKRKAKKIRLVPVRNAIDGVTDIVTAVRDAKDALSDDEPNEAAVKGKIDSVIRAVSALTKAAKEL